MHLRRFAEAKSRARLSLVVLVAVGVAAAALSACGSSSTGGGATGTSTNAGGSKTPLEVGSIISATGTFGPSNAGAAYGVKAWADYVNAHGGINGHKVDLTVDDDKSTPSLAISDMRTFAGNPQTLALLGNASAAEGSFVPLAGPLKMPTIGGIQESPAQYQTPYAFPVGATFPSIIWGEVYAAAKLDHSTKIALFYCAELAVCAAATSVVTGDATSLGAKVVNHLGVPATAPNYDAQCKAAQSAGATAIVLALSTETITSLAQSCASIGYHPKYVAQTTAFTPDMATEPGLQGMLGVVSTFPWVADSTSAQKQAQAAFKAAKVPAADYGDALTVGYAAGVVFQKAVESIKGPITRAAVANALWGLKKATTTGRIAPPLNYGPANATTPQQKCFFVLGIDHDKITDPYNSKHFCQTSA